MILHFQMLKKGRLRSLPFLGVHKNCMQKRSSELLLYLGRLAYPVTQVVELGPTDLTYPDIFDMVNVRGMNRENFFHADTVGNASYGKGFGNAAACSSDNSSLENLNSFPLAFTNFDVHLDGVANSNLRGVFFDLEIGRASCRERV